jgi:hypothetical protein
MLHAGLDLCRRRLDFHLRDEGGETVEVGAAPPDGDGLRGLAGRLDRYQQPIQAAIESMNGARFVHDQLELQGWQVEIADAARVKGLAPLACKSDHRRLGAGRALPPRAGAGDLAARPIGARGAGTSALASPSRPSPLQPQAACPRHPARARQALPRLRPVRRLRPAAARPARAPRALGRHARGEPAPDRPTRPGDRRLRGGAAPTQPGS